MFFDDLSTLSEIIQTSSSLILSLPKNTPLNLKNPIEIHPDQSKSPAKITIDQVRHQVIELCSSKQTQDIFFIFHDAHTMTESAENSILKLIEEPKPHYHFIFLTNHPYLLLPTILSRSKIFIKREQNPLKQRPATADEIINLAKKLMTTTSHLELISLASEIHKKKDGRKYALEILSTAIELSYKTYFATNKSTFLTKIPKFIAAYNHIQMNGNLQLQLIANLC